MAIFSKLFRKSSKERDSVRISPEAVVRVLFIVSDDEPEPNGGRRPWMLDIYSGVNPEMFIALDQKRLLDRVEFRYLTAPGQGGSPTGGFDAIAEFGNKAAITAIQELSSPSRYAAGIGQPREIQQWSQGKCPRYVHIVTVCVGAKEPYYLISLPRILPG